MFQVEHATVSRNASAAGMAGREHWSEWINIIETYMPVKQICHLTDLFDNLSPDRFYSDIFLSRSLSYASSLKGNKYFP
jgi:hypothetical protein